MVGIQDFTLIASGLDDLTLATVDYDRNNLVRVYPNPVQENLFFDLPESFSPSEVIIYDISGKLIRSFRYQGKRIM